MVDYAAPHNASPNYQLEIGHDIWVGDNVVVLQGLKIGAGSIVAADLPEYFIVMGNPAKIISYRFPDEIISRLLSSHWWNKSIEELKCLDFTDVQLFLNSCEAK